MIFVSRLRRANVGGRTEMWQLPQHSREERDREPDMTVGVRFATVRASAVEASVVSTYPNDRPTAGSGVTSARSMAVSATS